MQLSEEKVRPEAVGIVCSYAACLSTWPPRQEAKPEVAVYRLTQAGRQEVHDCEHKGAYQRSLLDATVLHDHNAASHAVPVDACVVAPPRCNVSVHLLDQRPAPLLVPAAPLAQVGAPGARHGEAVPQACDGGGIGHPAPAPASLPWDGSSGVGGASLLCNFPLPRDVLPLGIAVSTGRSPGIVAIPDAKTSKVVMYSYQRQDEAVGLSFSPRPSIGSGRTGDAPLDFHFSLSTGLSAGGVAFTAPVLTVDGVDSTLLVAEGGNCRVQELTLAGSHVGYLYSSKALPGHPRGVSACRTHIAVSAWSTYAHHVVHLFDAVSRTVIRTLGNSLGHRPGELNSPGGLCFVDSTSGACVAVADTGSRRICYFSAHDGTHVADLNLDAVVPGTSSGSFKPYAVSAFSGGFLIAFGSKSVGWVSTAEPAQFKSLSGARHGSASVFSFSLLPSEAQLFCVVCTSAGRSIEVGVPYPCERQIHACLSYVTVT
jgi:hypothetical protein